MELTPREWATLRTLALQPLRALPSNTPTLTTSRLKLQSERQLSNTTGPYNSDLHYNIHILHTKTPAPLRATSYRSICFYCWHLDPFLCDALWVGRENTRIHMLKPEIENMYLRSIIGGAGTVLWERFEKGLLRKGQVRLVEAATRALEDEVKGIMAGVKLVEESGKGKGKGRVKVEVEVERIVEALVKVYLAVLSYWVLMQGFLGSKNFRSERMENTLLSYLAEEEVDVELVGRLDRINWDFKVSRPFLKGVVKGPPDAGRTKLQ